MKIAALAPSLIPSNTANSIQVMKTCSALAEVDGELCLWVPGEEPVLPGMDWDQLSNYYGIKTRFDIRQVSSKRIWRRYDLTFKAVGEAQRWGADLLYTWMIQAGVLALWRGLPVILELHDLPQGRFGPTLFRLFARQVGRKRLLVITDALRRKLDDQAMRLFPPGGVQVAPNGVDLGSYINLPKKGAIRRELNLPEGNLALYSGHFYPGRGMDLLLGLAQRLPQVIFLWVGGTPAGVTDWQQRLSAAGVKNVQLSGFIENGRLPLYQAAADVLLMPYEIAISGSSGGNSAEICSPMKMFDYLAAGRVIVSSDLPVFHEVLNENNAVFCPPGDLDAWEQTLTKLFADPERREGLGSRAKADAGQYSWKTRAERALQGIVS